MAYTYRLVKGSPLTHAEYDENFFTVDEQYNAALEARDRAQEWAELAEDTEVVTGSYSAFHWAQKAAASVGSITDEVAQAQAARDAAQGYATDAQTYAGQSMTYRDQAEGYKNDAQTYAGNASTSADLAEDWAIQPEDIEVTPGNYSALHWAAKADAEAVAALSAKTDAETAASNAAVSETNAGNSANAASLSENTAEKWAENPEDIEVTTGKYSALHHAAKAATSATNAATSETAAKTSETNAGLSEVAAQTSATNAGLSETAAQGYSTDAQTYAGNALDAKNLAEDWASNPENVEVIPGEYSAKHWAAKADAEAAAALSAKTGAETARDLAQQWAEELEDVEVITGAYSAFHWAKKSEGFRDFAQTYAGQALSYRDAAETFAGNASISAADAEEWATKAEDLEVEPGLYSSLHYAAKADDKATIATAAANAAEQHKLKAQAWAEEAEDVEVETGMYSAKHHSAKAQGHSTTAEGHATIAAGHASDALSYANTALGYSNKSQAWAEEDENVEVETSMYSAKHWAAKALENSAGRVTYVTDYGAVGDGATDDSTAIQNAINSGADLVYFPGGDYLVSSGITLNRSNVTLVGEFAASRLINNTTNTPALTVGDGITTVNRVKVQNLVFSQASGVTAVAGNAGVLFNKVESSVIRDVIVYNFPNALYNGIELDASVECVLKNVEVQDCIDLGVSFDNTCIDIFIDSVRSDANNYGFSFEDSEGFYVSNCTAYNNNESGWVIGAVGACRNMFFVNCIGDTSGAYNWKIISLKDAYFTNCWGATNQSTAVNVYATGFLFYTNTSNITLTGCVAINNNSHGFSITDGANKISLVNCVAGTDSAASRGNGRSGSGYGFNIGGASGPDIKIVGGQAYANASGGFNTDSTLTQGYIQNVLGVKTKSVGNSYYTTDASGEVNIPHGLGLTPTWAEAAVPADTSWKATVISMDATNLRVRAFIGPTNADIANSSVPIRWRAEVI